MGRLTETNAKAQSKHKKITTEKKNFLTGWAWSGETYQNELTVQNYKTPDFKILMNKNQPT